jgi:hypothetical protein
MRGSAMHFPPDVAKVVDVLLAAPADAKSARNVAEQECHNWNSSRSRGEQMMLRPRTWELDSVPLVRYNSDAQSVLNPQLVDEARIGIVVFRHRLGTPTQRALSGTVEELHRMASAGKPVHCYFSTQSLPNDIDLNQLQALRDFKRELNEHGLVSEYRSLDDLRTQVRRALDFDVRLLNGVV